VFESIGLDAVEHAFIGCNVSLFAYGQTSSGKTFSMMGVPNGRDVGLIPRICRAIFHFSDLAADEYEVRCISPPLAWRKFGSPDQLGRRAVERGIVR
jgi:hypothetical protein